MGRKSYCGDSSCEEGNHAVMSVEDDNTTSFGSKTGFVEAAWCRSHVMCILVLLLGFVPLVGWTWWNGGAPWQTTSTSTSRKVVVEKGPRSYASEKGWIDFGEDTSLVIGDVNILILTDTHGFMGGHNTEHEPKLNIDFGHVLSLYQRLKDLAAPAPLFLVHNGDFCDGTGLSSSRPPPWEIDLLQQMPWDAMNVGNHELYNKETIVYLEREMIPHADYFISSNAVRLDANSSTPTTTGWTGRRFRIITQNGVRVLFFGFLYNMKNYAPNAGVTVEEAQDVMQEEWLTTVLLQERYDAIVVMAHMDLQDALVEVIRHGIRSLVSATLPVLFLTGHTHYRGYYHNEEKDAYMASFEAGRYLDTVGFISFRTTGQGAPNFRHVFLNAQVASLQRALDSVAAPHPVPLDTPDGLAMSRRIQHVRDDILHLEQSVACQVPQTFFAAHAIQRSTSLWRLYLEQVLPFSFPHNNNNNSNEVAVVQSKGILRYDLFSGTDTVDDVFAISPFPDKYVWVAANVSGVALKEAFGQDGLAKPSPLTDRSDQLPKYPIFPLHYDARDVFATVLSTTFDASAVAQRLNVSSSAIRPVEPDEAGYNVTARDLWMNYLSHAFPCFSKDGTANRPTSTMVLMKTPTTTTTSQDARVSSASTMWFGAGAGGMLSDHTSDGDATRPIWQHAGLCIVLLTLLVVALFHPAWRKPTFQSPVSSDCTTAGQTAMTTISTGQGYGSL